jgi:hypothetical protein
VAAFRQGQAAVSRLDLVVVVQLGQAAVFQQGQAAVSRLDPVAAFRQDQAAVSRLDLVVVVQLGQGAVSRLGRAGAFLLVLILGIASLPKVTNAPRPRCSRYRIVELCEAARARLFHARAANRFP